MLRQSSDNILEDKNYQAIVSPENDLILMTLKNIIKC